MKIQIVVLLNQFLNQTNYKRFNVGYKNKKIELIFWSLTPLLNKKVFKEYYSKDYGKISKKNYIYIKSFSELFKNIKRLKKNTIFLNLAGKNFKLLFLEFLLVLKKCIKIELAKEFFSLTDKKKYRNKYRDINTLLNFGIVFTISKALRYIYQKTLSKLYNFVEISPKYYFVNNEYSFKKFSDSQKKVFKYTSNQVLQAKGYLKKKVKNNLIVYIDQEFENSFETKVTKNRFNLINKDKFLNCLNLIFKKIEIKNKTQKIIIASHFRRSKKNLFDKDRKNYFNKTIDLIYNSKLVIAHNSTAINYAILFNKPILLLNFKVLDSISLINGKVTDSFADELKLKKLDIDLNYNYDFKKIKNLNFSNIKLSKYNKYKTEYLSFKKNQNVSKSIWDCISSNINKII